MDRRLHTALDWLGWLVAIRNVAIDNWVDVFYFTNNRSTCDKFRFRYFTL